MKYLDLELAFDFVNLGGLSDASAYVSRSTGKIFYVSDEYEDEEEIPEDLFESDDYVVIPGRHELDLGQKLVWEFVLARLPEYESRVRRYFSHPGAYSHFKALLDELDLLREWHEYEDSHTRSALLEWCRDNGLEVEKEDE